MKSSDQAALPPGGSEEDQLATRHSLSPSKASGPSPRNQVGPAVEQLSAFQVKPSRKALHLPEQQSSKSIPGAYGKAQKAHAEPFISPQSTRQGPVVENFFASRSPPEMGFLSDTTSKIYESMGNVLSKFSKPRKRDPPESPETTVSLRFLCLFARSGKC